MTTTKAAPTGAPIHRCTEQDCPYLGQPTYKSCRCHKTGEQMLIEQRDQLIVAGKLALEYWAHRQQRYKNRHPVWVTTMRAAIASAEGGAK